LQQGVIQVMSAKRGKPPALMMFLVAIVLRIAFKIRYVEKYIAKTALEFRFARRYNSPCNRVFSPAFAAEKIKLLALPPKLLGLNGEFSH
jgi:hypothetical protein